MHLKEALQREKAYHPDGYRIDTSMDNPGAYYQAEVCIGPGEIEWVPATLEDVFRTWPLDGWRLE